jgi:hypothetical protein
MCRRTLGISGLALWEKRGHYFKTQIRHTRLAKSEPFTAHSKGKKNVSDTGNRTRALPALGSVLLDESGKS